MVPNCANEGDGWFELLKSDISGSEARFEGRFEGTLIRFECMDDVPNPDDTIEVELYFDVTAKPEELTKLARPWHRRRVPHRAEWSVENGGVMRNLLAIAVLAVFAASELSAGSAASSGIDGEHLYRFHGCANCHGERGMEPVREAVPRIGGVPAEQILDRARAIIEARADGAGMKRWARDLYGSCSPPPSLRELERIAEWLSISHE